MTRASDLAKLLGAGATILDGTTISTADNDPQLILTSTDADGDKGPVVQFTRDSGSPADNDTLGRVQFLFDNDAAEVTTAVQIEAQVTDVSNGSEDASLNIVTMQAGGTSSRMKVNSSETVFNDDSKDVDFRVESDGNPNMLVVNAGVDGVAIGGGVTSGYQLQINNASGHVKQLLSAGANSNAVIAFGDPDLNDAGEIIYAHNGNSMRFHTNDGERMRIDSSGNVGISVSSPQELLHIKDGSIVVGNGTASNNAVIGRIGFSTDASNSRFIGMESFRGGDAANGDLRFHTFGGDGDNGERMRIDNSGKVGIGTSVAPHQILTVTGSSGAADGALSNGILALTTGTGAITDTRMLFGIVDDNYSWIQTGDYGVAYRVLILNPNGGNVLVGTTNQSPAEGTSNGVRIGNNGTSQFSSNGDAGLSSNRTGDNGNVMTFRRDGTIVGTISVTGSSTAFNTSSDYRLKENINYEFDATSRIKQLKPCRFNFIADKDTTVDGFIAHEVSDIIPEAVIGKKDAMTKEVLYVDDDEIPDGKKIGDVKEASKIDAQGIDQSKIIPLLVKTIQELEARITTLEGA